MKLFKVKDKSGRAYGITKMNQTELFRFIRACNYDKRTISGLSVGQSSNDFPAVWIKRIR